MDDDHEQMTQISESMPKVSHFPLLHVLQNGKKQNLLRF